MSTSVKVLCVKRWETLDPDRIMRDGKWCSSHEFGIAHPNHPLGHLLLYAMVHRWTQGGQVTLIDESHDFYTDYFEDTHDVTDLIVHDYNKAYGTTFEVAPKRTSTIISSRRRHCQCPEKCFADEQ